MRLPAAISLFGRRNDGAALVEFAILLPIMLLMFAFAVEGGRLMWSYQATAAGVRDAARYLARVAGSDLCSGSSTNPAVSTYTTKLTEIVSENSGGNAIFNSTITVDSVTPSLICVTGTYRVSPAPVAQVTAQITITFPFSGIFALNGGSLPAFTTTITDQNRIFGV